MPKVKVPVLGTIGKSVAIEADAPSRTEMNTAIAAAIAAATPSTDPVRPSTTIWRFIQEIPANITALASLAGTGLVAKTGTGAFSVRSIAGTAGNITVANGSGAAGNPTIDLAAVTPGSGGDLVAITTDSYGRVTDLRPALLGDISDVDFVTDPPTDGDVLKYDGVHAVWYPGTSGGGSLATLTDVDLSTNLLAGQVLSYDAGSGFWVNSALPSGRYTRGADFTNGLAAVIVPTNKVAVVVTEDCSIIGVEVLTLGGTGSCVLDIAKSTYAGYPPTVSICGAAKPTISAGTKYQDFTLTGWTTALSEGDTLLIEVQSSTVFTYVAIRLILEPTGATAADGYTDERVRDVIAAALLDTSTVAWTYNDSLDQISANVPNDSITYAKMQNVSATSRFLGRITAGAGDTEELTGTQATSLLNSFTRSLKGLAPASGGTSGTANFLCEDGSWSVPPGTGASFPLLAPNGSVTAPSYSFSSSHPSGMYWLAPGIRYNADGVSGQHAFEINGTLKLTIAPNATHGVLSATGSAANITGALNFGVDVTTTAPSAGGGGALPATPLAYFQWTLAGNPIKVPYYPG
jgi:hypothetical protein